MPRKSNHSKAKATVATVQQTKHDNDALTEKALDASLEQEQKGSKETEKALGASLEQEQKGSKETEKALDVSLEQEQKGSKETEKATVKRELKEEDEREIKKREIKKVLDKSLEKLAFGKNPTTTAAKRFGVSSVEAAGMEKAFAAARNKNYQQVYFWFKKMADDFKNGDAAYQVLIMLTKLINIIDLKGEDRNKLIRKYLNIAIDADDVDALAKQADFYLEGQYGFAEDRDLAIDYYKRAMAKGHLPSQYILATIFLKIENEEARKDAFGLLKTLVFKHKYTDAYFHLAECYGHGWGTKPDVKAAFSLYKKASELGHVAAITSVGECYLEGTGTEKDIQIGLLYLEKAAKVGSVDAYGILATIYSEGDFGVTPDYPKAFENFLQASKLGDDYATFKVGIAYLFGIGVALNRVEGFRYIEMAYKKDVISAKYALGICYSKGLGCQQSDKKAFACFEAARLVRGRYGIRELALCYKDGRGVKQDKKMAFEIIQKLVENNKNVDKNWALEDIAILIEFYTEGVGVEPDPKRVTELFQQLMIHYEIHNEDIMSGPKAYFQMAKFCFEGKGIPQYHLKPSTLAKTKDTQYVPINFLLKAAECYYIPAILLLVDYYHLGFIEQVDAKQIFEIIFKAMQNIGQMSVDNLLDKDKLHVLLGNCYLQGFGVPCDFEKAFAQFDQAIPFKNLDSFNLKGICILKKKHLENLENKEKETKDKKESAAEKEHEEKAREAFQMFEKAAKEGHQYAENNLAWCYLYGIGTNKDENKAFEIFCALACKGSKIAINNMAWCYWNGLGVTKDEIRAKELFIQNKNWKGIGICHQNNVIPYFPNTVFDPLQAEYRYGLCLYYGYGVEQNKESAFSIIEKYAAVFHGCKIMLANCYFNGVGVPKNKQEGYKILRENITKHMAIKLELARCYLFGRGVTRTESLGIGLLEEARSQGSPDASHNLALCYEKGHGVPVDPKHAMELYKEAARRGLRAAQLYFGQSLQMGHSGLEIDLKQGFRYIRMAKNSGSVLAKFALAECYELGRGTTQDLTKAIALYRELASQGHSGALQNLALILENGYAGQGSDPKAAHELFQMVANLDGDKPMLPLLQSQLKTQKTLKELGDKKENVKILAHNGVQQSGKKLSQ